MARSRRGRGQGGRGQLKSAISRLRKEINGFRHKTRNTDPTAVVVRPWYNLVVEIKDAQNIVVVDILNYIVRQGFGAATDKLTVRMQSFNAWGAGQPSQEGSDIQCLVYSLESADQLEPIIHMIDEPDMSRRAHLGYTWSTAQRQIPLSNKDKSMILLNGFGAKIPTVHFNVLWTSMSPKSQLRPPRAISNEVRHIDPERDNENATTTDSEMSYIA